MNSKDEYLSIFSFQKCLLSADQRSGHVLDTRGSGNTQMRLCPSETCKIVETESMYIDKHMHVENIHVDKCVEKTNMQLIYDYMISKL